MTEIVKGKTLQEALALVQLFKEFMRGERSLEGEDLGDLEALQGVRKYPVRIKCALLAWTTLEEGINEAGC
jgi:nitrogen fixation NifU-like protein